MKKSFIIASIVGLGGLSMLQTACDNYDDLIPQQMFVNYFFKNI